MSYLIFDGVVDDAESASPLVRNTAGLGHRYTITFFYRANGFIAGPWNSRGIQLNSNTLARFYYASSAQAVFNLPSLVIGDKVELVITVTPTGTFIHSGTIEVNDGGPVALTWVDDDVPNIGADATVQLGRRRNSTRTEVWWERFLYEDLDNASNNEDWDANTTNRTTGTPVLENAVSANDITGNPSMPTDGSAWSDLSGSSTLIDVLFNGLQPSFSAGITVSEPQPATHGHTTTDTGTLISGYNFQSVTGTALPYTYNFIPAYTGSLNIPSRYVQDGTNDIIDPVADAKQKAMREAITSAQQELASISDDYLSETYDNDQVVTGAVSILDDWAINNALLADDANGQGRIVSMWALCTFAQVYLVMQADIETNHNAASIRIKDWFSDLANVGMSHYNVGDYDDTQNHDYWASYAVMNVGVIVQDSAYFRFGLTTLHRAKQQMVIGGIGDWLSEEVARGTLALSYHQFALIPIVCCLRIAKANGIDLYSDFYGLVDNVASALRYVDDPTQDDTAFNEITTLSGQTQNTDDLLGKGDLTWATIWTDDNTQVDATALLVSLGEDTVSSNLGGNVTIHVSKGYPVLSQSSQVVGYTVADDQELTLTNDVTLSWSSDWYVRFVIAPTSANTSELHLIGNSGNSSAYIRADVDTIRVRASATASNEIASGRDMAQVWNDGQLHSIEVFYDASTDTLYGIVDSVPQNTRTPAATSKEDLVFNEVATGIKGTYAEVYIEQNGVPLLNLDFLNTSNQTQILDLSGNNNNATIVNPITGTDYTVDGLGDGFVPFTFGYEEPISVPVLIKSDVLFNGLQPSFSASVTVDVPDVTSTVLFNGLQPNFSASVTVDVPTVTSDVLFNGLQPSFSADVTVSEPSGIASVVRFNGLQPSFSSTVEIINPPVQSTVRFNGLQPSFNAAVTVVEPAGNVSTVLFNGLQPSFSANVELTYEPIEATVRFNGLQPSFRATIVNSDIEIEIVDGKHVTFFTQSRDLIFNTTSRTVRF